MNRFGRFAAFTTSAAAAVVLSLSLATVALANDGDQSCDRGEGRRAGYQGGDWNGGDDWNDRGDWNRGGDWNDRRDWNRRGGWNGDGCSGDRNSGWSGREGGWGGREYRGGYGASNAGGFCVRRYRAGSRAYGGVYYRGGGYGYGGGYGDRYRRAYYQPARDYAPAPGVSFGITISNVPQTNCHYYDPYSGAAVGSLDAYRTQGCANHPAVVEVVADGCNDPAFYSWNDGSWRRCEGR